MHFVELNGAMNSVRGQLHAVPVVYCIGSLHVSHAHRFACHLNQLLFVWQCENNNQAAFTLKQSDGCSHHNNHLYSSKMLAKSKMATKKLAKLTANNKTIANAVSVFISPKMRFESKIDHFL